MLIYKKLRNEIILELEIPEDSEWVSTGLGEIRASAAVPKRIVDNPRSAPIDELESVFISSNTGEALRYTIGVRVEAEGFEKDPNKLVGPGIYGFTDLDRTREYWKDHFAQLNRGRRIK